MIASKPKTKRGKVKILLIEDDQRTADFIIKGNQLYFLELNSIPGMSEESIIPQHIQRMGLKVEDVLQEVIDNELN